MADRIKHERILLERPARVFIEAQGTLRFETHCQSRDLSISGIFLNCSALLRVGTHVNVDLEVRPGEVLDLNGEVVRRIEFGDREHEPGFAVKFGELSARAHETLLRYFVTDKIARFTTIFHRHFPHLDNTVSEQDLALIVNLWEDNRHHLSEDSPAVAPVKLPPPTLGPAKTSRDTQPRDSTRPAAPLFSPPPVRPQPAPAAPVAKAPAAAKPAAPAKVAAAAKPAGKRKER